MERRQGVEANDQSPGWPLNVDERKSMIVVRLLVSLSQGHSMTLLASWESSHPRSQSV